MMDGDEGNERESKRAAVEVEVVDWESQAKQALSDLVVARDTLSKLKAMLSSQIRMDSVAEKLTVSLLLSSLSVSF